ncbi:MAG: SRPBCC family protein [Bacteroidota bacterium]
MHITRSVDIDAPAEKILPAINDFNHWDKWSPWLIMEPEATVEVADDAKSYSWTGKRVGEGKMAITNENGQKSIDYDLTFLKPWKSEAKVRFELEEKGDSTKVTWFMDSSLPFFLFWMKKMTEAFVGMDYERGLNMLKDYVETGDVPTELDFKGRDSYRGCQYVGVKSECSMKNVGPSMEKDFEKLHSWVKDNSDNVADKPFSIYHKWDMVKDKVVYTSGIPVKNLPDNVPPGMVKGSIPSTSVYTIGHKGPYRHLGNAWTTGYNMKQNKVFKMNNKVDTFETYVSDPSEVSENELITEVHFPVK